MIGLTVSLALAFASPQAAATLPKQGVLVPGRSLGGVRLGDTQALVRRRWGSDYRLCGRNVCHRTTWMYTYKGREPVGAAVSFRDGRVAAVFTLGAPDGWHTADGMPIGGSISRIAPAFGDMTWRLCIGYGALSKRNAGVVTSIYTAGEVIYGFALTRPAEPVCQ